MPKDALTSLSAPTSVSDDRLALLNVLEDIEEERQKSARLITDLQKYKQAVENAYDHIVITDPDGVVLFANDSVTKITGFPREEVLGKKAGGKDLWGGLMPLDFYELLWRTIKVDKKPFVGEVRNKRKSGEKYTAFATISPVLDENKEVKFFIGVERDITKEKEVDRMKTEFISLVSHQLRTPLTGIKWFAEMLIGGDAGNMTLQQQEYLGKIQQSNERMISLVNALLNVSRMESGRIIVEPEMTDLTVLVDSVLDDFAKDIHDKSIEVIKNYGKIPEILVDPKLIRNVYQNLISNAVKYSFSGSKIGIRLTSDGDFIKSEVSDTGMGIPKADLTHIYEKFFRATNIRELSVEGNGLGLYLVNQIVQVSGGTAGVESIENKGSTFWFTLPIKGSKAKKGEVGLS